MAPFRDWIPEGEDVGGQGRGFRDFVPAPEPVETPEPVIPEIVISEPEAKPVEAETSTAVDDLLNPRRKDKKV